MLHRTALALVAAFLVACGGGSKDNTPTGPDIAGQHPAGSLIVASGDAQSVAPGEVVPVPPVVRVLSDRGRPLQGAELTLAPEGGRGTLEATSATTDANGEVRLPKWTAPLSGGAFAVLVTAPSTGTGGARSVRVTATVTDPTTPLTSGSIGPSGGTIRVTTPTSPLNGLTITFPPGAFRTATSVSVSTHPAITPPNGLAVASPVVEISAGGKRADSLVTVRIPAAPGNGSLVAFAVTTSGTLVPVATLASDASSATIGVRKFTAPSAATSSLAPAATTSLVLGDIAVILMRWVLPTSGVFGPGFATGADNLAFVNYGSYWESAGYCAGSTVVAGAWFLQRGTSPVARTKFPALLTAAETQAWSLQDQLNPAIRLASALQTSYGPLVRTVGGWKARFGASDASTWKNVVVQLAFGQQPVFLAIFSDSTGHAVLAYKVDVGAGKIWVADPNYPDDANRVITYTAATNSFAPFPSAPNASAGTINYTEFMDGSFFFAEDASTIASSFSQYAGDGLKSQYPSVLGTIVPKKVAAVAVSGDTTTATVDARDSELRLVTSNLGSGSVSWVSSALVNGVGPVRTGRTGVSPVTANGDTIRIPLRTGLNTVGLIFRKTTTGTSAAWYDAKAFLITKKPPLLGFLTQPANGFENTALPPVKVAVVDEDTVAIPEVRQLQLTLTGGTPGATLSGVGTPSTLSDGTLTLSGLMIDKVGTGYRLQLSSPGLPTVTSQPFDVTTASAVFKGRAINAMTLAGLGSVTIAIKNAAGQPVTSTTTTASGDWTAPAIPTGTYRIEASLTGFVQTNALGQVLTAPTTIVETIPMVPNAGPGPIAGSIRNAINNQLITSTPVTVKLMPGINATPATGGTVTATVTTTNGNYLFGGIAAGVYTVVGQASGFTDGSRTGIVVGFGSGGTQDLILNPVGTNTARIVLTWGNKPDDIDSHLTGPIAGSSSRFWVYFNRKGSCTATPFACLDVDDTFQYGPETMTISQVTPGVYRYYVYDYINRNSVGTTALGLSNAKVEFYTGGTLRTFFVPTGIGNAWAVFEWDGSRVTVLNQLYTISGTPTPQAAPRGLLPSVLEELRQMAAGMTGKSR